MTVMGNLHTDTDTTGVCSHCEQSVRLLPSGQVAAHAPTTNPRSMFSLGICSGTGKMAK